MTMSAKKCYEEYWQVSPTSDKGQVIGFYDLSSAEMSGWERIARYGNKHAEEACKRVHDNWQKRYDEKLDKVEKLRKGKKP